MTVVIVGGHGAGKSTLGRGLAAALGAPFHEEIGARLAADPRKRPLDRTAADAQADFDDEVFRDELARDATTPPGRLRVVETWHPGNLAYAHRRSPAVASRYLHRIRAQARDALVIPVRLPLDLCALRQHEPGDPAFFATVGHDAERWARVLGLRVLAPVWNVGSVAEGVAACLHRLPELS